MLIYVCSFVCPFGPNFYFSRSDSTQRAFKASKILGLGVEISKIEMLKWLTSQISLQTKYRLFFWGEFILDGMDYGLALDNNYLQLL